MNTRRHLSLARVTSHGTILNLELSTRYGLSSAYSDCGLDSWKDGTRLERTRAHPSSKANKIRIANLLDAADNPGVTVPAGGVLGAMQSGVMASSKSRSVDGSILNSSTAQGNRRELEEADSAPHWIPGFYKQMQDAAVAGGQRGDAESVASPAANLPVGETNAQGLGAHFPASGEPSSGIGAATEGKGPQQQTTSSNLLATAYSTARQPLFDSIVRRQARQGILLEPSKQRASLPPPTVAATASHRILELASGAVLTHHGDARLAIAQLGQPATAPRRLPSITAIVRRRVLELGGGRGVSSQHGEVSRGRSQSENSTSFSRAPAAATIATRRGTKLAVSGRLLQHGEAYQSTPQIEKQSAISRSPIAPAASAIINSVPRPGVLKRDPGIVDYSVLPEHGQDQTEPAATISATPDGSNVSASGFIKPGDVLRHTDLRPYDEGMEWSGAHPRDFMSSTSPGIDDDDLTFQQPPPKRAKTGRTSNNELPENQTLVTQVRRRARSVRVSYVGENPNRAYRRKQEQRRREPHLADLADHREMAARILGRDSHWMEGLSASNTSVKQMRGE
ncbi:hypothetical protein LTR97_000638 [Elasticomyces elasticus]|uniref:Uncharacterized protein n=1 Tax=Elasticomyces elasticus TaxID=574655 RepID=A0AAN7WD30_9PEZI|nr:hypothetical protein LTR97_000638 [Elasticomyces elasticus]